MRDKQMRICPQCKRDFGEQEFRVCPFDGAALSEKSAQTVDPMLGRVLDGRFQIIETIGRGGMGAIYKAIHKQMDRVCAVKLLSPVSADWDSAVARFRREAKLTSRIDSPNAVTIYDFGEAEPGLLYIAMEYIEGESLAQLLARERSLAPERVVKINDQIAGALTAAHSLGIVHRDLKPANIMLVRKRDDAEVVKVLDFGIAKSMTDGFDDHLTQTGFLLGTPTYMSPEQVMGESVDARSDVYSLALIVYQMLSGRMPFEGDNLRALMMKRVNGEPTPLRSVAPFVTPEVERVVMSALSRDPETRIADARHFAARFSAASAGIAPPDAGQGSASAPLAATQLTPSEAAAMKPPPSPFVTLASQETPEVEESGTILAPQIPYNPETISAAAWQIPSATTVRAGATRRSKLLPLTIAAVALVAALAAGGIYFYRRAGGTTSPVTTPQPASQTSPGVEQQAGVKPATDESSADEHYRVGKSHQKQAASLAAAGSRAAAAKENEQAVAEYRKALESRPTFPEVHENLGVALHDLGRAGEAVAEYEVAIKQYGNPSPQVLTNYGMALFDGKRYKEAADAFSQALALQPNDADLHYYRGFALHYAGDKTGSRAAFDSYLKAAPQGPYAKDVKDILAGRAVPSLQLGGR